MLCPAADADGPAKAPHIFQITADAFKAMTRERRSQSIVVSGESGAGKTETTKKALQLLASLAGGTGIADRVMDVSGSCGCATARARFAWHVVCTLHTAHQYKLCC